ncbi:MAG: hypothetical protein WBQ86_19565 [Candidatus Binatus sp.]
MAKMFFSLGFWMTIVLFVALGYALGAECSGSMSCGYGQSAITSSVSSDESRRHSDLPATERFSRRNCDPNAGLRGNLSDFQQMANLQAGGPTYAPGFSLGITRRPPEVSLCPGAVQIPRH